MIEAYAFLAAFAVQILALSVLKPAAFIRYVRGWATNFASERYTQLYQDFDYAQWAERFAVRFRAANLVIVLPGVALLGWMFFLIGQPDWASQVTKLTVIYFYLQVSPAVIFVLYSMVRHYEIFRQLTQPSLEAKRKASLQRRGLFDFVSPTVVSVGVLSYILFIPFAFYVDLHVYQNASPSRYCYQAIAAVTLVYALNVLVIYKSLYGKRNALVNQEGRARTMAVMVKSSVYVSIAVVWFVSIMSFATKLSFEGWKPFAVSVFMVLVTYFAFEVVLASPPKPRADGIAPRTEVPS